MTPAIPPLSTADLVTDKEIADARKLIQEIHAWAIPLANSMAVKFGMSIPNNVTYSFEKLPDKPQHDGTSSFACATVALLDDNKYEIKVDLANCVAAARQESKTLHDYMVEVLLHELGHIAKKADLEFMLAAAELRNIAAAVQAGLAHNFVEKSPNLADVMKIVTNAREAERLKAVVEPVVTLREGFGDYLMSEAMSEASRQGRLNDPNWAYDSARRPRKYSTGRTFIATMVDTPGLGPPAVTRLLRTPYAHNDLLPTSAELESDFPRWATRAQAWLMGDARSTLPVHPVAIGEFADSARGFASRARAKALERALDGAARREQVHLTIPANGASGLSRRLQAGQKRAHAAPGSLAGASPRQQLTSPNQERRMPKPGQGQAI